MRTFRLLVCLAVLAAIVSPVTAGGFDFDATRIRVPRLTLTGADSATTQVLFNDAGLVAGDSGMTWNKTTNSLTITGALYLTATDLTAGSGIDVERMAGPRTMLSSFLLDNADVVALGATTTGNVTIATIPAKMEIDDMKAVVTSAAVGPTTVTMSCGRTASAYIDYLTAVSVKSQVLIGESSGDRGTNLNGYDVPNYSGTTSLICQFISSGGNLSTVTGFAARIIVLHTLNP